MYTRRYLVVPDLTLSFTTRNAAIASAERNGIYSEGTSRDSLGIAKGTWAGEGLDPERIHPSIRLFIHSFNHPSIASRRTHSTSSTHPRHGALISLRSGCAGAHLPLTSSAVHSSAFLITPPLSLPPPPIRLRNIDITKKWMNLQGKMDVLAGPLPAQWSVHGSFLIPHW